MALNARKRKMHERAFFVFARLTHECHKISNLIQHSSNVAKAQNYNSRKFGLKMCFSRFGETRFGESGFGESGPNPASWWPPWR